MGGGGNNHFYGSRNNVMITESVGGMNVNKLTRKGSDNQVQSVSFSCREVHLLLQSIIIHNFNQDFSFRWTQR